MKQEERASEALRRDDRGSLPLALLLIVVGVGLSGLLASSVNEQVLDARYATQRTDALDAAQSGIQVGLGHIRTAEAADGSGDVTKLPCGPWSGAMSGGTRQTYIVTIYYLTAQPPPGDTTWAQANKLPCAGTTYGSATPQPLYAMLASTGTVVTGERGRTVTATYALRTNARDTNLGGLIHLYGAASPDLCFAAPSAAPASGDALTMQVCDLASDAQRFAYTPDLTLALVATRKSGTAGMCLQSLPTNGHAVLFRPCTTPAVERQQWAYNDSHSFEGITSAAPNNICFHLATPGTVGSAVVLHAVASDPVGVSPPNAACHGVASAARTFTPEATVGAGRTGPWKQLVNFGQYSACVDLDASSTVLMQPCEQRPSGGAVTWQQVWNLPTTSGRIWTRNTGDGKDYCLTSTGTGAGKYVTLTLCPAILPTSMIWTRGVATGVYRTAYRIESTFGAPAGTTLCLSPTDPAAVPPDPFLASGVTRLIVSTCGSSTLQKWNAPASFLGASLIDVGEK